MDSSNITNYDVLVVPPVPQTNGELQLDKSNNHAGNNRLEVFLNMYRQSYDSACTRGDVVECNNVVDKILATVCHQCVPRGRFLVSTPVGIDEGSVVLWNQMDEPSAKLLLHRVLQPSQPKVQKPAAEQQNQEQSDEEKKRRRRSSLLRRSASESLVGMVLDNKKKMSRFQDKDQTQEEPATWKSNRTGDIVLKRMDIILTNSGDALDPNSQSVGNNRLHILVAMQSSKYQQASAEGKESILNEVIQTVNMFWKGRFLVKGVNGHEELSKQEARNALRSIFFVRAGQSLPKRNTLPNPSFRSMASAMPLPMRTSTSVIQSMIPTKLVKQSSASMINSGPAINIPDVESLRFAAVNQLKKKKARQRITKRIEHQSGRNIPPVINSFVQNASPPIAFGASRVPQKRESTVLGKLDPSLMSQLVAEFDDADFNELDDPLPPTNSNKFGSRFSGGGYM